MADGSTKLYNSQHAQILYRIKDRNHHSVPPPEADCCIKTTPGERPFTPEPWDTTKRDKRKAQLEEVFQRRKENYKRFYKKLQLQADNDTTTPSYLSKTTGFILKEAE
jgi:hypothetical protein